MAKIKKGDLVQVIAGRTSDAKKLEERNARRAELGLDPLKPGDRGKQGVVLSVDRRRNRVVVEGVNRVTRHVKAGPNGGGGIETVEAPIHMSKVALVGPDKKPVRVGFREVEVERDGRTKVMRERIGRRAGKEIEL
ncbi:MAG: 50S ribosomal protein L24 [Actinomyces sp.]|jgi:ribosomal protein L24|nr:MAG: 50S ribosomal protein L24 [Actinomyces sp.]